MKKNLIKPMEIDGMLYQKTNEDFNKEKPNPLDLLQIKGNSIMDSQKIIPIKKTNKK